MSYFDAVAKTFGIAKDQLFGKDKPEENLEGNFQKVAQESSLQSNNFEDLKPDEEMGPSANLTVDEPKQVPTTAPPKQDYLTQAKQLLGNDEELSAGQKFSRGLRLLGAGMRNDGSLRQLERDYKSQDEGKKTRALEALKVAQDLAQLEESNIRTDILRQEVATKEAYAKASRDPNSFLTKAGRGFAIDAIKTANISKELKEQLTDFAENATAEQLSQNKLLESLGITNKLNLDTIKAAQLIATGSRAERKDERDTALNTVKIDSEKALTDQRTSAAEKNRKLGSVVTGSAGEKKRDEQYGKDLDSKVTPAIQKYEYDKKSFESLKKIVISKEFTPNDLASIANAYENAKGNFGIFSTYLLKQNLSAGAQDFASILARLAPDQRPAGSGATSNLDLQTYLQALGSGITNKNVLLNRIREFTENNDNRLNETKATRDYFMNNGTLKGFTLSPPEITETSKYSQPQEINEDQPKKNSKYPVQEIKEDQPKKKSKYTEEKKGDDE